MRRNFTQPDSAGTIYAELRKEESDTEKSHRKEGLLIEPKNRENTKKQRILLIKQPIFDKTKEIAND